MVNTNDVRGLLLHLIRGARKHGSIDEKYLKRLLKEHKVETTFSDLVNE